MKVFDTPRQARSLREIEAGFTNAATKQITEIYGTIKPSEPAAQEAPQAPAQNKENKAEARKKKNKKGVR